MTMTVSALLLLLPAVCAALKQGARVVLRPPRALISARLCVGDGPDQSAEPAAAAVVADAGKVPLKQIEVFADSAPGVAQDADDALPSFGSLGVSVDGVVDNLAASNITTPNALQRAAFEPIASGRDAILHAWTGSGKTLAFLLPLLERLDPTERSPQLTPIQMRLSPVFLNHLKRDAQV